MNAILPNSSGDGNSPRSLHPDALQQETSQLQKQIVDVSAESKAEKELLTGKVHSDPYGTNQLVHQQALPERIVKHPT
jgi:hypothetical protein